MRQAERALMRHQSEHGCLVRSRPYAELLRRH
jgi:hypothetical protein